MWGGGVAQAASNIVADDRGVCTGYVLIAPKLGDADAARWNGVIINDFKVGGTDLLIGSDGPMKKGKSTKLELRFTQSDLDKEVTLIKGLGQGNNSISEETRVKFRKVLEESGVITDSGCMYPTDQLLRSSNAETTPFETDGRVRGK